MDKNKNKITIFKIVFILALSNIFIESFLYFKDETNILEAIYLGIANTVLASGFAILLEPSDIFEEHLSIRNIIYIFSLITLPVFMISALVKLAELIIKEKFIYYKNKENILVFGYNDNVKNLLSSSASKNNIFYVCSNANISEQKIYKLIKDNIIVYNDDFHSDTYIKLLKYITKKRFNKIKSVLLFEDATIDNISIYVNLINNLPASEIKRLNFHFVCEDDNLDSFIHKIHDISKEEYNNIFIIDINHLKLMKLFNNTPIHTLNIKMLEAENENILNNKLTKNTIKFYDYNKEIHDVHILLVGLNKFGQDALKHVINNSILHYQSKIIIDIIDNNTKYNKSAFFNNIRYESILNNIDKNSYFEEDLGLNKELDGKLKINFHDSEIVTFKLLQELTKENSFFTYVIICEEDANKNISNMITINDFLRSIQSDKMPPVAVKINNKLEFNNKNNTVEKNIIFIEPNSKIITLDNIINHNFFSELIYYNYCYNKLAGDIEELFKSNSINKFWDSFKNYDKVEAIEKWNSLTYYKKESNRYQVYSKIVKNILIEKYYINKSGYESLDLFKEDIELWFKNTDNINAENLINELIKLDCIEYIKLYNLFALENRRWNYFVLFNNWSYGDKKDEAFKTTPYLVSYKTLCENNTDIAFYDLLGYLLRK